MIHAGEGFFGSYGKPAWVHDQCRFFTLDPKRMTIASGNWKQFLFLHSFFPPFWNSQHRRSFTKTPVNAICSSSANIESICNSLMELSSNSLLSHLSSGQESQKELTFNREVKRFIRQVISQNTIK